MINNIRNYNLILGSKSPRRQQFLKELNIPFKTGVIECEEIYPDNLKAEEITEFLAALKAKSYSLKVNEILITADTIVWLNGKALEKPNDKNEAVKMLLELSNTNHEVISSICLSSIEKTKIFTEKTKVYFRELTLTEIEYYIDNYKPFDKAGSYGIQEWIGLIGVTKIEGSYANVVGMPVDKLYMELKKF